MVDKMLRVEELSIKSLISM